MERTIDDLFKKIYQSENLAQKRNNLKIELKQAVQRTNSQLKDLQDECLSLQGQLMLKQQKLREEELNSKWLTRQEEILKDQRDHLQQQIQTFQHKKTELEKKLLSEERSFCQELEKFSTRFDLSGHGSRQRELQKEEILQKLQEEETSMKEELDIYNKRQIEIDQLSMEKEDLNEKLRQLQEKSHSLSEVLETLVKTTLKLEEEKISVTNIPQRDPEFTSLQQELSAAKCQRLEERCNELQKEYQQLQQRLWQRKVQQRQQLLKQQQKQQQKYPLSQNNSNSLQLSQDTEGSDEFSQELLSEMFSDSDGASDQDYTQTGRQQEAPAANKYTFKSEKGRKEIEEIVEEMRGTGKKEEQE